MIQSKSHNNLINTNKNKGNKFGGTTRNINMRNFNERASKVSSDAYKSSIHQCHENKLNASKSSIDQQLLLTEPYNNFELNDELDNCITNGSETLSSKFNGHLKQDQNAFASHDNISVVPNYLEDPNYSSTEEIAADFMKNTKFHSNYNTKSQKSIQGRYDGSSEGRKLKVDTSPNALMLKDI